MKTIMIPIKPQYAALEMNGKKTIEVRKFYIEPPFKVVNYVTQKNRKTYFNLVNHYGQIMFAPKSWDNALNGKVALEYVVNKVDILNEETIRDYSKGGLQDVCCREIKYEEICFNACLSYQDIYNYSNDKTLYAWHISDLKIYDKPKEITEYFVRNKELEKRFIDGDGFCCYDGKDGNGEPLTDCSADNIKRCYECWEEWSGWCKRVTRPPQNFIYVEEIRCCQSEVQNEK